jgi:hypothetical protein
MISVRGHYSIDIIAGYFVGWWCRQVVYVYLTEKFPQLKFSDKAASAAPSSLAWDVSEASTLHVKTN